MGSSFVKWSKWFLPVLGCMVLFAFVHLLQSFGHFEMPRWGTVSLSVLWGVTLIGYLGRFEVLKRIGGLTVVFVAVILMVGMLLPKEIIGTYPEQASGMIVKDSDAAWKTVYGKDLFREFSLHKHLMQYAESLSRFDIHRAGQVGLFFLFGVALGICFLFPVDPFQRRRYGGNLVLLWIAGGLWALQMEFLQVLSPTREVTFVGFVESLIGVTVGIGFFALLNIAYVIRKGRLSNRRFNVLGVGIDAVDMGGCLDLFEEIIGSQQSAVSSQQSVGESDRRPLASDLLQLSSGLRTKLPAMTTAMGVAGIVESRRNQKLQRILNESVLNTPDGMPLVWLGKLFGYRNIDRVYGPDLLRDVCAYGADKGWRHFFYGAAPGIVEKLQTVLENRHPNIEIAGIYCPPFRSLTEEEETEVVEMVNRSKADIFWIGISTPKQLYFMDQIRDRLDCKIICPVGYAFDVNGGVEKDAPDWIKAAGLQWLHRAIKQPRLWKRYLPDNPAFIMKVFAQISHLKKFPLFVHERPVEPYADAEGYPRFPAGVVSLSAMTLQSARDRVAHWIDTRQRHYVNICTADTIVQCYDQPELANIVMKAGMATTDGTPLVWLARHFGFREATRVYGPDLMLELCALSEEKGYTHYFYGATDKVLAKLQDNLLKKFPRLKIAGLYSPPFRSLTDEEKDEVSERINAAKPDIVWCGLGTPKQDYWVSEFRPRLDAAALLAVGAAFNFHAGHIRQAPRWMMRSGLEWLFRLCLEPRRLWRRYIIGNPRFIIQTLRQWSCTHRDPGFRSTAQPRERRNAREPVKRTNVLGVGVSAINMDTAVETLLDARAHGRTGYVCVTGVHGVIESQRDAELKRIHNRSFLTVPDGMPTVWMGREQGFVHMGRVYGPDLMLEVCRQTSALNQRTEDSSQRTEDGLSAVALAKTEGQHSEALISDLRSPTSDKKCFTHFLYGSTPEVLEKLKANLEKKFPGIQIVGTFSPPFRPLNDDEEKELQQIVAACKPDFFWVGLSTPKQEKFMARHSPVASDAWNMEHGVEDNKPPTSNCQPPFPLEAGIMIGVGAAFDIHAGLLKDAPEWIKNSGLQWFYRLCQEPRRLWRRYLDIVPRFLSLTFLQLLGIRKYNIEDENTSSF